jgi:FAD binding domain
MIDPFLTAHWTAPRIYDISGKLSPVSIRDQMIRGRLFAERAHAEAEITSDPNEGLLVVGAGAAGMTAALTAASLGVRTVVLEASPRLFGTQAGCSTRWIDPAQYDWPLLHWTSGQFPIAGRSMPLPWNADWADQVASVWLASVQQFLGGPAGARLIVEPSAVLGTVGTNTIQVAYTTPNLPVTASFGALLFARGFGTERIQVGTHYRGFAFWETDPCATPHFGVASTSVPSVLISGAGDGALQDFHYCDALPRHADGGDCVR